MLASGQEIVTSARRNRPWDGRATGRLGLSLASSSAIDLTRAAWSCLTRSAAAPVSFTKVAVEASPAITPARGEFDVGLDEVGGGKSLVHVASRCLDGTVW